MDHRLSEPSWRQEIARRRSAAVAIARIMPPTPLGSILQWQTAVEAARPPRLGWTAILGRWLEGPRRGRAPLGRAPATLPTRSA